MVARLAEEQGLSGRQVTQSACGPLLGVWRTKQPARHEDTCLAYQKGIMDFVAANPNLKLAILSAYWSSYQHPLGDNGLDPTNGKTGARDPSPHSLEQFLKATADYLSARGVKVLILGQVPHWTKVGKLPVACAIDAKRSGADRRACGIPAATSRRDLAVSNDAIRKIARGADVSAILGTDLTCDETECYAMMDGVFLYRNPGHLNKFGSEMLAKYVQLPPIAGDKTTAQARITAPRFAPASAAGN